MISVPYHGAKRYQVTQIADIAVEHGYKRVIEPISNIGIIPVNLLDDGIIKEAILNDIDGIIEMYPDYLDAKDFITQSMFDLGYHRTVHSHLTNKYRSRYYLVVDEKNNIKTPVARSILEPEGIKDLQRLVSQIDPKFYRLLAMEDSYTTPINVRKAELKVSDFNSFRNYVFTDKQRQYLKVLKRCKVDNLPLKEFLEKYDTFYRYKTLFIFDPIFKGVYDVNTKFVISNTDMQYIYDFAKRTEHDVIIFHDDFRLLKRGVENRFEPEQYTFYPVNNGHRIPKGKKRTGCFVHIVK